MGDAGGGLFEFGVGGRVHVIGQMLEEDVAREIVGWISGAMAGVAAALAPAERSGERVMAADAVHFAELRPGPGTGRTHQPLHGGLEGDGLADGPGACAEEWVVEGVTGGIFLDPVRWLDGGEAVEFESEVWVAGGDQLMVHAEAGRAEMAGEAALGAEDEIAVVVEPEGDHLRVLGVGLDMRPDPA